MSIARQIFFRLILLLGFGEAQAAVVAERLMVLEVGLNQPTDVAVRDDGRVYVLDGVNGRVVVFTRDGERDFAFSRPGNGPGELRLPVGIIIGKGEVFVADTGNHRIAVFNLRGDFIRNIPLTGDEPPEPVALALSQDQLLWTDRRNHQVCAYDLQRNVPIFCQGKRGESRDQFQFPFQIAVDSSDYLYVTDVLNGRIQVLHPRGQFVYDIARFGLQNGELFRPNGLAFAGDGLLLVGDSYLGDISLFLDGKFVGRLRSRAGKMLHFHSPVGIEIQAGRLYVTDAGRSRVEVFRLIAGEPMEVQDRLLKSKPVGSGKNCISCHLSWASQVALQSLRQRVPQASDEKVPAVVSPRMCYSCHHGAVVDSRQRIGRGGQHPDIHHPREKKSRQSMQEANSKDKIPAVFPLLDNRLDGQSLSCGSCHTPHGQDTETQTTLYASHGNPWLRVPNRDGDLCQQCHSSKLASRLDPEHPPRGVNHPVGIYLKAPPLGGVVEPQNYASDKHLHMGLPDSLGNRGGALDRQDRMTCQTCHQIHGGEGDAMTVLPITDAELCIECHPRQHAVDKKDARKKGVHPVDFKLDEPVKIGGKAFKHVTCFTCHSVHAGKPETALLREDHRDGKLCSVCHEGQAWVVNSDHDLRLTAKTSHNLAGQSPVQSGVCGACHRMHSGKPGEPMLHAWERHDYKGKETALERDTLCLDCHRQKGVTASTWVERFSHPARDLILRSDPKRMPLIGADGKLSEFGAIGCVTCHDPHRWTPQTRGDNKQMPETPVHRQGNLTGNVLNSFLRQRGAKGSFCIDCHGIEAPLKYKYYHAPLVRDQGTDYLK
ncbi:MAG: 6-bladed beta-propeller [Gammaproteobacteria bacterium]|nr:6-bladed beta-propeller [Gammaproteobacteria bacterium]MCF6363534.1 6-bladed beta-propeller [Gammaproteobacteria bacterium]